jgi:hypothetical protein
MAAYGLLRRRLPRRLHRGTEMPTHQSGWEAATSNILWMRSIPNPVQRAISYQYGLRPYVSGVFSRHNRAVRRLQQQNCLERLPSLQVSGWRSTGEREAPIRDHRPEEPEFETPAP